MMCKSEVLSMNAVIYARYSSDNQREESIEGQIRECTAYAERNGITVVRHYIDRALSAKTDNRPDFQQMIRDSNKKLFEIVLVWKFDRFARNRFDSANYKMILKKNNVHLISVMEPIAEGSQGILVETLLAYYMSGFNVGKTAEALYIHRNSLQYRLKKIEEILEVDLEDSMEYLDIVNCILVKRLMFN